MNVGEVYNLFQSLVDDTDQTFLTAGNTDTYLKAGYSDFRQRVSSIDPDYYVERTHMLIASDADKIDLTVGANFTDGKPVLGATAVTDNKLMSRLIRIAKVDDPATDKLNYYLTPTNTSREVAQGLGDYCVNGVSLILAQSYNSSYLRLEYIRDPVIAWTDVSTAYIDDLAPHHQLIALYAAQYYAIRDGAFNEPLNTQLLRKERELETYLTTGRVSDAAHYITPQRGYGRF
jgi:hypothetical protein